MRGATVVLAVTLLLVIAIAAAAVFFGYVNTLRADVESAGQRQLVELEVPPKLLSLVCYDGYGYLYLSLSQGQNQINGTTRMAVHDHTGTLTKEMFLNITLSGPKKIYLPVFFVEGVRYKVAISGRKWELTEYCTAINDPHMVMYLPMDDETGSTVSDQSGNEQDCTLASAAWTTGLIQGGLEFNGSSTVDCSMNEDYNSSSLTVSVLVNITSLGAEQAIWGGYNTTSDTAKNYFHIGSDNRARLDQYPPSGGNVNTSALAADTWWHIVTTKNSSFVATYVNGIQNSTNTTVEDYAGPGIDRWAAGYKYFGTPTAHFTGVIDELRVYSRALGPDEVEALYHSYTD